MLVITANSRKHPQAWPHGGGGGNNAFRSFFGTCKPTNMSFVPTKYLKYQQNIDKNSSFRIRGVRASVRKSLKKSEII